MAGRPKKETEEIEEVVEIKESITEKVGKNLASGRVQSLKKTEQTIDDEDLVAVASFASGKTQLTNSEKPYDEYIWDGFGTVEDVRFGTLKQIRKKSDEAFKTMLYVLDDLAIKELGLAKVYEKIGSLDSLINIFDKPVTEIVKFVDNSSPQVKAVLAQILHNKLERKESIDYFSLKILAEKLGIELNSDL